MRKLTLDQAWSRCLREQRWIIEQLDAGSKDIIALKKLWFAKHPYKRRPANDCWFCQYAEEHGICCSNCPGVLVSERFRCWNSTYYWYDRPRDFYKKIFELNETRLLRC